MWRAEQDTLRRERLTAIGADLRRALEIVRGMPFAGTPQQASAWFLAERATAALGALVADDEGAFKPVPKTAAGRVVGKPSG